MARRIGIVLGLLLIAVAIAVALRGVDWSALRHASPWQLAALLVLMLLNIALTAALNWLVTRSFDARPPVSLSRMTLLIGASGLLNYLWNAGTLSRAAYLRARHGLPLRQSAV